MTDKTEMDARPVDLSVRELACLTGLREVVIRRLITLEVIEPDRNDPEPLFRVEVVERIRRIRRLHVELGASWSSMPLILELLDRIDRIEHNAGP